MPIDVLGERARQALVSRQTKQVFLRMDAGMTAQEFLNVMDTLKDGGVEAIGLVALDAPDAVRRRSKERSGYEHGSGSQRHSAEPEARAGRAEEDRRDLACRACGRRGRHSADPERDAARRAAAARGHEHQPGRTPGPKTGGMQMIGGTPDSGRAAVDRSADRENDTCPPSRRRRRRWRCRIRKQKPRTPPKPTVASKDPKGTAVGRGFETQQGTAKVETGAKGQGFGLSSGGAGGDGGVKVDVSDFCCPEYIGDMRDRIIKNWNQNQRTLDS